jgi:hypothetical protein
MRARHRARLNIGRPGIPLTPELTIQGEPATFATRNEKAWQTTIREAVANCLPAPGHDGLTLAFAVSAMARNGQPFDLDNLCEPVFCALAAAGWLDKGRRGLRWWSATKAIKAPAGVTLQALRESGRHLEHPSAGKLIYRGAIPKNARDPVLALWVADNLPEAGRAWAPATIGLGLRFGSHGLNIGAVNSTKGVKSVIDGLYPLLGGKVGAPNDWKIAALYVERACPELDPLDIEITFWDPANAVPGSNRP